MGRRIHRSRGVCLQDPQQAAEDMGDEQIILTQ